MKHLTKLKDLKEANKRGIDITFEIIQHKNIPNTVFYNKREFGYVSISTIKSYKKYLKQTK